jgi:hypothetical protein
MSLLPKTQAGAVALGIKDNSLIQRCSKSDQHS